MSETKAFHISDVITAATGMMVSTRHMEGIYDILNWMTGDNLFTHALPRASREAEPLLRETFPELVAVEIPKIDSRESCDAWLETLYPRFGEYVDVPRLPEGYHTAIDPISELSMMMPGKPIIPVHLPPGASSDD